jgi:alkylhydroperoxidase/carboxymuconolactone decarboxylase family protein YurZ
MDPITPHLDHGQRKARREHLDGLIQRSAMKVPGSIRALGRQVFADGALSKKHKELTALALAVANNCWE